MEALRVRPSSLAGASPIESEKEPMSEEPRFKRLVLRAALRHVSRWSSGSFRSLGSEANTLPSTLPSMNLFLNVSVAVSISSSTPHIGWVLLGGRRHRHPLQWSSRSAANRLAIRFRPWRCSWSWHHLPAPLCSRKSALACYPLSYHPGSYPDDRAGLLL